MLDPWDNQYQYLKLFGEEGNGGSRKDRKLNPLNSDFDLYSMGKDGQSKTQIWNRVSLDDVIRANYGKFIHFATNLNLKVVAEGSETIEQVNYLKKQDCDQIQGYIYSEPLTADVATTLFAAGKKLTTKHLKLVNNTNKPD